MRKTLLFVWVLCLTACTVSVKKMTLLPDIQDSYVLPDCPFFHVEEGDILRISLSSMNQDALSAYLTAGREFAVDDRGEILLPILGSLSVGGKTEVEVEQMLLQTIRPQVSDVLVRVHIINATVTLLGEVREEHHVSISRPIPLLEAISSSGGFTRNARRDNILVQRRENGKLRHYRVNLLTDTLFTSPCFYLQKGDIVYVSPLYPLNVR